MSDIIEKIKEIEMTQGLDGNWNYDKYMHGMYNGIELILSVLENRDPKYKERPDRYIIDPKPPERPKIYRYLKELDKYNCPFCREVFIGKVNYCHECGEAIPWKDSDIIDA